MTRRINAAGLLLFVALFPAGLSAQMGSQPQSEVDVLGEGVEFFGLAGVLQPLGDLTDHSDGVGLTIPPNLLLGGEITLWPTSHVGIGLMGFHSATELGWVGQLAQTVPSPGKLNYSVGIANVVFRIIAPGSAGALEPYAALGAGFRSIDFHGREFPPVSSTDPMASVAIGMRISLVRSLWMRGEIRNMASFYHSQGGRRLQNDVGITVGFGLR